MPIHDQSYRRYRGGKEKPGAAWVVIATAGIVSTIRKRKFLGLLLFAWLPFFIRAVQIYIASSYPQASMLKPTAQTFRDFLGQQQMFVFFITIYVGAGLIANDKRANALQIYLAKPLGRAEYVGGKLAILACFLLLVTWVPGILLLFVEMAFSGSATFIKSNLTLIPSITVFSFLSVLLASFTMIALSSLSKSSRFVGIMYAAVTFFSDANFEALRHVLRTTSISWMSVPALLEQMGDVIFRQPPRYDTPWPISLLVILALVGVSALVLERKVRGVEVVT
ncbi:MAG: hypothetical protein HYZ58_11575 [Acidobacteria bacterium]|nr:hypothetical protein [Acidobacteriota bacterium]